MASAEAPDRVRNLVGSYGTSMSEKHFGANQEKVLQTSREILNSIVWLNRVASVKILELVL